VRTLEPYKDGSGNEIVYDGDRVAHRIEVEFDGRNNKLVVAPNAEVTKLRVIFRGNDGVIEIGGTGITRTGLRFTLRVGHGSRIEIGENVGCQDRVFVSASEGADVTIGCDTMFATGVELRADDAHAIYSVRSGERLNPSRSIHVGEHVWIAKHALVMGGVTVGDGSVIGFRSIVTSDVPNNCVAVGAPARVVRRDIAWERPAVARFTEGHRYPPHGRKAARYWKLTRQDAVPSAARRTNAPRPARPRANALVPAPLRPRATTFARRLSALRARWAGNRRGK
jgi:acetyltransferase-like isoleucine patch superfamily enzyme